MTGEITLRGEVLPVGGLKEKIIGAKRAGIKKIFLPQGNEEEVNSFDKEIISGIRFIYVNNYLQVFDNIKEENKNKSNNKKQVKTNVKA